MKCPFCELEPAHPSEASLLHHIWIVHVPGYTCWCGKGCHLGAGRTGGFSEAFAEHVNGSVEVAVAHYVAAKLGEVSHV